MHCLLQDFFDAMCITFAKIRFDDSLLGLGATLLLILEDGNHLVDINIENSFSLHPERGTRKNLAILQMRNCLQERAVHSNVSLRE